MYRILLALGLLLLPLLVSPPAEAARDERLTAEDRMELGQRYLKRGYYTKALEQFNRIRNYYRDDPISIEAELAIADLYFKKAEWDQARLAYEDFRRLHPRHDDVDYVSYRIGLCFWRRAPAVAARDQTYTRYAVDTWSGFQSRHPDSEYSADVADHLRKGRDRLAHKEFVIGRFYWRRGAWSAAAGRLEGLLRDYPSSPDTGEALALLGQCRFHLGERAAAERALERVEELEVSGRQVRRLRKLLGRDEG